VAAIGSGFALARSGCAAPKEAVGAQPRAKVCVLTPEAMEAYFDPKLVRSDITEGKPGAH
jgi:hypothetical protein